MSQLRTLITLLLALILFASCKGKNENEKVLTFSAIPDQNSTGLVERYSKLSAYLEK